MDTTLVFTSVSDPSQVFTDLIRCCLTPRDLVRKARLRRCPGLSFWGPESLTQGEKTLKLQKDNPELYPFDTTGQVWEPHAGSVPHMFTKLLRNTASDF